MSDRLKVALLCVLCASVATSAGSQRAAFEGAPLEVRVGVTRPGGGYSVTTMPLEGYVARVLSGEAARDSEPAALEALAITIRTFTLANRGRHRADDFDVCDTTHCQVFRASTPATERAATATAGRVLLHDGAPASVFYSASCGGRTEIPSAVWPGSDDPPFLPSQPDDACGGTPVWTAELAGPDLMRAFRAAGFRGERLRDMDVLARDGSGRVARLGLTGLTPAEISGQDLRVVVGRTLGWQHVKSAAFELERVGDRYLFNGRGSGHGVGLCVIGSTRLAVAGQSATQILARYFPGLDIGPPGPLGVAGARPSPPPRPIDIALALPDEDEGERAALTRMTAKARDEMAGALGVAAPKRLTVRFHPTIASYERTTGQPWFTSGTVTNGGLHLVPLAVLRERGMLERTLRRDLVRVMADPVLHDRPLWVREGAAIYFSGGRRLAEPAGERRLPQSSCPADAELAGPVSPGSLSNAYARAGACFARQIERGTPWREIK